MILKELSFKRYETNFIKDTGLLPSKDIREYLLYSNLKETERLNANLLNGLNVLANQVKELIVLKSPR